MHKSVLCIDIGNMSNSRKRYEIGQEKKYNRYNHDTKDLTINLIKISYQNSTITLDILSH